MTCCARSAQSAVSASVNAGSSGSPTVTPDAPFARTSSVSFVLVSPSTEIALNVRSAALSSVARSVAASTRASVVTNARSVAMCGWIIPAPFATPPRRTGPRARPTSRCASLGFVSVVMIARAIASPASVESFIPATALAIRSTGNGTPMTPVLATATSYGDARTSAAAALAIATASSSPCSPVHAFAFPLLTTIARNVPPARCRRVTTHGAAMTWFVVKIPAALHGRSDAITATSSRSGMPCFTPAAATAPLNPRANVTPLLMARAGAPRAPSSPGNRASR